MYRTKNCGQLRIENVGQEHKLAGWIHRVRKMGGIAFIELRDRYGVTQLRVDENSSQQLREEIEKLGREFVVSVRGIVEERSSKNSKIATGDIELKLLSINVLNKSVIPPFTIEEESDGGEELRAKFRYLDLRRPPLKRAIELRHKISSEVRKFLDQKGFLEIETPSLIKSTPEGARDFVVPSRVNPGEFYALPQSPQTFKQLLMVAGFDRYFQIVRCFRDEDLRADRQPEFTQIDCELSFVEREDVLQLFEGMMRYLFKEVLSVEIDGEFPRISYREAMSRFGSDKPDLRFGMEIEALKEGGEEGESIDLLSGRNFPPFDSAPFVGAIAVPQSAHYSRRELDQLTEWLKRAEKSVKGLIYIKVEEQIKSSIDKFYSCEELLKIVEKLKGSQGDLILILAGDREETLQALGRLRIEMASRLGLRDPSNYKPLWVYDFPLLEWDSETSRFYAKHHPFTAPKEEDFDKLKSNDRGVLSSILANAYDFVLNGSEIGGGSIRIDSSAIQNRMFEILGHSQEEIDEKFGFILNAFRYGAPPHGGIAFGLDRLCALFGGDDTIRDYIAFPKNNSGRDVMLDAPSVLDDKQLEELSLMKILPPKQ
ncbi:MAG: aspartate--tRNA ligase [Bacteroidales bacterium]